jgi:hypothetical protein
VLSQVLLLDNVIKLGISNKEQGILNDKVSGSPPFGVQVPCSEFLVPCSLFNKKFLNLMTLPFGRIEVGFVILFHES